MNWRSFLLGSAVTLGCGIGLYHLSRCHLSGGLTIRQAFILTPLAYFTLCIFAALPLYISNYPSYAIISRMPSSRRCRD